MEIGGARIHGDRAAQIHPASNAAANGLGGAELFVSTSAATQTLCVGSD